MSSRPYLRNGQVLSSPPLTIRLYELVECIYAFVGLYFVTLFSLDAYAAAERSVFNLRNHRRGRTPFARGNKRGGGGGGDGGGPRGPGGGGAGGKGFGSIDDIRSPECKSCS